MTERVAVVTGGASGIGRATAVLLAEHRADVFVGDFDLLDENATLFGELGIRQCQCDVRVEGDVERLVAGVAGHGLLDRGGRTPLRCNP